MSCHLALFSVAEENAIVIARYKNSSSSMVRQTIVKPPIDDIVKDKVNMVTVLAHFA